MILRTIIALGKGLRGRSFSLWASILLALLASAYIVANIPSQIVLEEGELLFGSKLALALFYWLLRVYVVLAFVVYCLRWYLLKEANPVPACVSYRRTTESRPPLSIRTTLILGIKQLAEYA